MHRPLYCCIIIGAAGQGCFPWIFIDFSGDADIHTANFLFCVDTYVVPVLADLTRDESTEMRDEIVFYADHFLGNILLYLYYKIQFVYEK